MKIKAIVQKDGKWVEEVKEVNRIQHYWYSLQIIFGYYWNRFIESLEKER